VTGREFLKRFTNRLQKPLIYLAIALREPKSIKLLKNVLTKRTTQLAVQTWLKFGQWLLAKVQPKYKTKKFLAVSDETRKAYMQQMLDGKADWDELKRNRNPGAPNFAKLIIKHGWELNRAANSKNPKKVIAKLRPYLRVLQKTLELPKVKQAIVPKTLYNFVRDYLEKALDNKVPLRDIIGELPKSTANKLLTALGLKLPRAVVQAFRKPAANVKVGRVTLARVIDEEGALVLRFNPEDIKFPRGYVVFYHPALLYRKFKNVTPQRAARIAEKMVATVSNLLNLLKELRKDYYALYGARLRINWKIIPIEDVKRDKTLTVFPPNLSAMEVISKITEELKEAHGEVAKIKSMLDKGEKIYLENEDGDFVPATVVKINPDGTVVVKVGRERKIINPMTDHFLTEEEYKKLTGMGKYSLADELSPEELQALDTLGIKIE